MTEEHWQPSQWYLDYCRAMRTEVTTGKSESKGIFGPCERYERIEDGCAICVKSVEERPCPGLVSMFTGVCEKEVVATVQPSIPDPSPSPAEATKEETQ